MPTTISTTKLNGYISQINSGGVSEAIKIYSELNQLGYKYAGWAEGVAAGTTVTGLAALDYLKDSSIAGISGNSAQQLTAAQIDQIRVDMAIAKSHRRKAA